MIVRGAARKLTPMSLLNSSGRVSPAALLIVPLAFAIVLTLFVWPSARLEPRDLPVAVAGPPAATAALEQRLAPAGFDVTRLADERAARAAIEDRDVYGAFVATPSGARLLTASAASASVARLLEDAAADAGAAHAEDVVPAPSAATGLSATVLPLVTAGSLAAIAASLLAGGALARAGLVVAGSLLAGATGTLILQDWLGVIEGDWAANAGALSLTVLATSAFVAGLNALIGRAGMMLGGLTMVLVGNPFAGVSSAPELLPEPAGAIGQLMPPGAGGSLLRSTGYFDGAAASGHVTVLAVWALAGLGALLIAALRDRRRVPVLAPAPA
jgi:hypothetical protein